MTKSGKPSSDDIELFRRSVGPVRKVHLDKTGPIRKSLSPRPRQNTHHDEPPLTDCFSDGYDSAAVTSDEALFFTRPGLQQRQLQRLKRGQLPIGAELDMHGMTAAEARGAVVNFIALCRDQRIRCVRLIHGKGYGSADSAPVLKNRIQDGGSGALYVLLKSKR